MFRESARAPASSLIIPDGRLVGLNREQEANSRSLTVAVQKEAVQKEAKSRSLTVAVQKEAVQKEANWRSLTVAVQKEAVQKKAVQKEGLAARTASRWLGGCIWKSTCSMWRDSLRRIRRCVWASIWSREKTNPS